VLCWAARSGTHHPRLEAAARVNPARASHVSRTHTARTFTLHAIVKECVRDRQHWVILCTPDCGVPALTLEALHHERTGETMEVVFSNSLPYSPAVFFFPREHLSLAELGRAVGGLGDPPEAIAAQDYVVVTGEDFDTLTAGFQRWLKIDHLLS
jgi:hypothetical protein